jgi:surface protein
VNNGIFVQNLLDKPSSDTGLPRGISAPKSVSIPYNYPGDDKGRIDQNSVVFVVDTRYGTNTSATLSAFTGSNLAVNWGDGIVLPYSLGVQYNYANHGVYIVQIGGPSTSFGNIVTADTNRLKIIKCLSFGSTLTSLAFAFSNNSNIGLPNLIQVPDSIPATCTNLARCFAGCSQIDDPNIRNWNTKNITTISSIFNGANLFNQDISSWDVGNVTDMSFAFQASRFNQPIGVWNVSTVTSFAAMFTSSSFNQNIDNWNMSNAVSINSMFQNCPFNQPIGSWNVGKVTNFSSLFFSSSSNGPFNQDLSSWVINTTSGQTVSMASMFRGCASFNNGGNSGINNWNMVNVTDTNNMFIACFSFNQPLNNWNTSNVTNMSSMFQSAASFNQPLNNWNVSKVTNFNGMFNSASSFNQNLNSWNTIAAIGTGMDSMFVNAVAFNGDVGNFNTSNVTSFGNMFNGASSFNKPIGSWNVGNVTITANMFLNATNFNQSLDNWNVRKCTNMSSMFNNARNFNSSLNNWSPGLDSTGVNCNGMFRSARSFNQNLTSWNMSKVNNISEMFLCDGIPGGNVPSAFQGDISNWNLAGLNASTSLDNFMNGKNLTDRYSTANYDALLIGWNNNKLIGANGVANWRTDLRPNFGGARYTAGGAAATARAALVSYGWTITDGGVA